LQAKKEIHKLGTNPDSQSIFYPLQKLETNGDFRMVDIHFDVIITKHVVGYILPDVAYCIDILFPTLITLTAYSSQPPNVFQTRVILTAKVNAIHIPTGL
jgi:hypothetical protein